MAPLTSILLLSLISLSHALPAAAPAPDATAELVPRACSTLGPSNINVLRKAFPDAPSTGQTFELARTGGPNSNTIKSGVTFEHIPAGATGCMLQIEFPPLTSDNQIASGTGTQADVWSTSPAGPGVTWNNPPVKNQFVATTIFPTGKTTQGFKTILASNSCSPTMSFLFELSDWQQGAGSVKFYNSLGGKQGLQPIGFSMIFNC
ncbi:hypothetical protein MMC16_000114 [Acarospora aff. strigata]|nr:hypothetical protein [Acarospora aff. strigata]